MKITEQELLDLFILYETANFKLNGDEDEIATMIARLVELKYNNFIEEFDLKLN